TESGWMYSSSVRGQQEQRLPGASRRLASRSYVWSKVAGWIPRLTPQHWTIGSYTASTPIILIRIFGACRQTIRSTTRHRPSPRLMQPGVGGITIHGRAPFPRFPPAASGVRPLDGVAADCPLTYAQLEPFFDLNDRMMGIAGITGDPAYPPKSARQVPPIPL